MHGAADDAVAVTDVVYVGAVVAGVAHAGHAARVTGELDAAGVLDVVHVAAAADDVAGRVADAAGRQDSGPAWNNQ